MTKLAIVGPTVHLVVHREPRALAPRVDVAAFRIVHEVLTNARGRAEPSRIDVTVS